MKDKLEVYIDYICPYCYRAYQVLSSMTHKIKDLQIDWRPCESHPRPERYGQHSDLCIQGFFLCRDSGGDIDAYNNLMYKAVFVDHINIEDVDELAEYVAGLIDPEKFKTALVDGKYLTDLQVNNVRAWDELGLDAVPSFRVGEKELYAIPGVGVSAEQLEKFLTMSFGKN